MSPGGSQYRFKKRNSFELPFLLLNMKYLGQRSLTYTGYYKSST